MHRNAKLTPAGRRILVERIQSGRPAAHVAAEMGVARKTANVVLGNAFGINVGVVVDTHIIRLSGRLGLSRHTDPTKIEPDLMALFPRPHWTMLGHLLIFHGRRVCKARGATCPKHPFCRRYCSNAKRSDQ